MKSGLVTYKLVIASLLNAIFFVSVSANEDEKVNALNTTFKVDFMSMHTWRGSAATKLPAIEPSFEISNSNTTLGVWVAHSIDNKYSEMDLYLAYNYKHFTLTVLDYFCPASYKESNEITNFNKETTNHIIELTAAFNGTERLPISFMVGTMVYGYDRDSETNENMYSTYFQFGYNTQIENSNLDFVLGFNTFDSMYGDQFGIVNAGIKASRNLKAFKNKEIPLQASLITNPLANTMYLKFGFTL